MINSFAKNLGSDHMHDSQRDSFCDSFFTRGTCAARKSNDVSVHGLAFFLFSFISEKFNFSDEELSFTISGLEH